MYRSLLATIFTLGSIYSTGQCLEYEEIEGICTGCSPTGWDGLTNAEEIHDLIDFTSNMWCNSNVSGVSPSGGAFGAFQVFSYVSEGISRTWSGLIPGAEYTFVMWWMSVDWECGAGTIIGDSDLWVTVDGVDYIYGAEDDWTLLELCIEALSDEITIEIKGVYNGIQGVIIVDDADCNDAELDCCELVVDLFGDNEICPEEDLFLDGQYSGDTGSATIEWVSDPADGVNFLDDTSITNPTFNFTTSDNNFTGTTYTFTMVVEDDICLLGKEIEIEVLPYPTVTFDFESNPLCADLAEFNLPTISEEGINGTWDTPILFPGDHPGEQLSFMFTPDVGAVMCLRTTEHVVDVVEFVSPTFDFSLEYCREAGGTIALPTESIEGIAGTWNIALVEMDLLPDGIVDLIFTPSELFCTTDVDWNIEILSGTEPNFTIANQLCLQDNILNFPIISNEGIEGSWSLPEIDPSLYSGIITNTFTPNPNGEDCFSSYEHIIEILDILSPQFDFPLSLCSTDNPITLETMSIEGYDGQWSIPVIDPATSPPSINVTWVPNGGQSPCVTQTELIVQIDQATMPEFILPDQICQSDMNFLFPSTSENGIIGSWSIPSIDPSNLSGTLVSIFLPETSYCAESIEVEIEIIQAINPLFSIEENICASDDQITLPITSDNGINGSWDQAILNPSDFPGQTVEITFIPSDPTTCTVPVVYIFNVEEETTPIFNYPLQLCWQEDDVIFQDSSFNNILGTWTSNILDIDLNTGINFINTFTPNADYCASSIEANIMVLAPYNVNYQSNNPSSCMEENGSIEAQGDIIDKLFSIDGGITWQVDPTFLNLGGGFYQLLISSIDLQDCLLSYDISLTSPNAPSIDMINTFQLSSCNENDGMITIEATGNDLEYSLDGGTNWQTNPTFDNLSPDLYDVIIRAQNSIDCEISAFATIDDFPQTTITNFEYTDITDCGLENGSILIEATGLELEYSIDNGVSWSDSGVFNNLPAGQYDVVVQSALAPECMEIRTQYLVAPGMPTIDFNILTHPSLCSPSSGQISIQATGNNLEYSIDGANWQDSPIFENLMEGTFNIMVRDADQINCVDQRYAELQNEQDMLAALDYNLTPLSACNEFDASIEVIGNLDELEFSIDGGNSWQDNPTFDFLPANSYTIIIRSIDALECTTSLLILIEEPACPCEELIVDYTLDIPDCPEDLDPLLGVNFQINSISGSIDDNYEYEWDNGNETADLSFLNDGSYTLTITYDDECEWIETFDVNINGQIIFDLTGVGPDCVYINNGSINISNASGGFGELQYSIDGINFQQEAQFDQLESGIYEVSVMDELGCVQTSEITIEEQWVEDLYIFGILSTYAGDTIVLDPDINIDEIDSFQWSPEELIIEENGTVALAVVLEDTDFIFSYQVGECFFDLRMPYLVKQSFDLYIPNVFSPDGDGNNDFFFIQSQSDILIESMQVYDRWGELMYDKENPNTNIESDGWNGRFKGQAVNSGVYVYTVSYEVNGKLEIETGTVTILN